jgi:hypothetical protein
MSFFPFFYSTIGAYTIINYPQAGELLSRVIGITINSLTNTFALMATNTITSYNHKMKEYMDELEILDIMIKLRLVENWLTEIDPHTIVQESSLDIIYRGITESCQTISYLLNDINKKIKHYNSLWFKSWRTIDLDTEIIKLKRATKILTDRLNLISIGCMWNNMNNHRVTKDNNINDMIEYIKPQTNENYYMAPGEENNLI